MKILHYTGAYAPAWRVGGPVRSVSQICEGLAARGHDVSVFTTNAELEDHSSITPGRAMDRNGVEVTYFPSIRDLMGVRSPELEAAVHQRVQEFDLVHVTGVWQPTSVAACRAATKAGIPYVVSPRGALGSYSWTQKTWKKHPYWWLYERRNCRGAAAVHYTTTMEAEECRRFALPGEEVIIPNSVGLDFWNFDAEGAKEFRARLGISPTTPILLNAGRLHHKKGLDILPTVLSQLKDQDWVMVFAGSDDDGTQTQLERAFAKHGLTDRVVFYPTLEPAMLRSLYSAAEVFLLPSRHENFGNVVIEAMACDCTVLLSGLVGVAADLDKYNSVFVLKRSVSQWLYAVEMALKSKSDRAQQHQLKERFSSEVVVDSFESLYISLISRKITNK